MHFVDHHRDLLDLYRQVCHGADLAQIRPSLTTLRQTAQSSCDTALVMAYDRYLRLIARRLAAPDLVQDLALCSADAADELFQRDPSEPAYLLREALACLHAGRAERGQHLLRRLARSEYPEAGLARRLLQSETRKQIKHMGRVS